MPPVLGRSLVCSGGTFGAIPPPAFPRDAGTRAILDIHCGSVTAVRIEHHMAYHVRERAAHA